MAIPFITDDDLKARLLACLQRAGLAAESEENWDIIVEDSNQAATNEIYAALLAQDFTAAQIADWDRAEEFNKDIGLFWCLVKGGVTQAYDEKFIRDLDRRLELRDDSLLITVDDEPVEPDAEVTGRVRSGTLTNDEDVFSLDMKL